MSDAPLFYEERVRPQGTAFLVVGIAGLTGAWWPGSPIGREIFPLAVCTFVFGICAAHGAYFLWIGGSYRTWLADERVHWAEPHLRPSGKVDSCLLAEIVEFQCLKSRGEDPSYDYVFQLCDGTRKPISPHCFGDAEKFARALIHANRSILYAQYDKQSDGTYRPWGA